MCVRVHANMHACGHTHWREIDKSQKNELLQLPVQQSTLRTATGRNGQSATLTVPNPPPSGTDEGIAASLRLTLAERTAPRLLTKRSQTIVSDVEGCLILTMVNAGRYKMISTSVECLGLKYYGKFASLRVVIALGSSLVIAKILLYLSSAQQLTDRPPTENRNVFRILKRPSHRAVLSVRKSPGSTKGVNFCNRWFEGQTIRLVFTNGSWAIFLPLSTATR